MYLRLNSLSLSNLFYFLIFLYFFTSCGDHLNVKLILFKAKLNNVLACILLFWVIWIRKPLAIPRRFLFPFLLILCSLAISSCFSFNKVRSLGYIIVYVFDFIMYFLLPFFLVCKLDLGKILKLYFLSFICIGCYAVLQLFFSCFGIYDPFLGQFMTNGLARAHAFTYEPSYYALYQASFVMFCNALWVFRDKMRCDARTLCKMIGINFLLLVSTSTGAFFAYFIFFGVTLGFILLKKGDEGSFLRRQWCKLVAVFCALFAAGYAVAPKIYHDFFFKFFMGEGTQHGSFSERLAGIVRCLESFQAFPIFGVGVGGIGPHHYYLNTIGETPDHEWPLALSEFEPYDPTNVASEILGSLGLFGALSFVVLFFSFWRFFQKTIRLPSLSEEERSIALSLFVSLVVVLLQLQFSQGLFRAYIWIHAAMTMAYLAQIQVRYAARESTLIFGRISREAHGN